MQRISQAEYLALIDAPQGTIKGRESTGDQAYCFGTGRAMAGGVLLVADAAVAIVVDELAPALGRKLAATIARAFPDELLAGFARAEAEATPIFFTVVEHGEILAGTRPATREKVNAASMALADFARFTPAGAPVRMTCASLSAIVDRIRRRAAEIGLELTGSICPPGDDPAFIAARTEIRAHREELVASFEAAKAEAARAAR
ncbi:MAG: hypothetical protein VYD64_05305 [Pseudomonadota bacterium]|nr:hypothetical protein [Pseudomonadota bacterium]